MSTSMSSESTPPPAASVSQTALNQSVPQHALHQQSSNEKVRDLMARLPTAPPSTLGTNTETVTKKTFTETTVKRVTTNEIRNRVEEVTLVKAGGPLGLSIIGGSDHSCVPFGTGEPGIFISKVSFSKCFIALK